MLLALLVLYTVATLLCNYLTVLLNLLSTASAYTKIHRNYLCKGWLRDYCFYAASCSCIDKWLDAAVRRVCRTTRDRIRNLSTLWLLVVWTTTPVGFNDHGKSLPLHVRFSEKSALFCDWHQTCYTHMFAVCNCKWCGSCGCG